MGKTKQSKSPTKKEELSLNVLDSQGRLKENILLDQNIFGARISFALLQQAINTYLSNKRKGLAMAKTRGEKSGGGKKPWRQKGTGRARAGSNRSPIWKGGGVTFAPRPHSYYKKFPERMRLGALKSALTLKLKEGKVILVEALDLKSYKAKDFAKIIIQLGVENQKVALIVVDLSDNIKRASANFKKVYLYRALDLNALGVLDCEKVIITKDSLGVIEKRLQKWT